MKRRSKIRRAGCLCPHLHLSCIRCHRFPSIPTSSGSTVPAPSVSRTDHRRDPQSRKTQAYAAPPLPPHPHPPPFCVAGTSSSSMHGVASSSRAFSGLAAALVLVRASENDIGRDNDGDVVFRVTFAMSPASPPRSARPSSDGGDRRGCYLLGCGSDVARHERRHALAPVIISIVGI
jgi:hypothetical protein